MFRPEAVPAGRRGAILVCVLFLAVVALDFADLPSARCLCSRRRRARKPLAVPDGDRDSPATADEDAGRYPYADDTYGDGTYGPEQRAQELYLDGMDKLGGGHREWAQETFESVIARFPDWPPPVSHASGSATSIAVRPRRAPLSPFPAPSLPR